MFNVVKCDSYDEREVRAKLDQLVNLGDFVRAGDRVMVKPNLLGAYPIERAVTTHPSVVTAVVEGIQALGASVIIADSPQGLFNTAHLRKVYEVTGMQDVADLTGCDLNYDTSSEVIAGRPGPIGKLRVQSALKHVDKVVNVCKVKCHVMAKLTCATKNLYGYVPGLSKAKHHLQMDMGKWANVLLELEDYKRPAVTIVDGIVGMEGDGPVGGDPKKLGVLIAGTNVFEIDHSVCRMIGLDPDEILYLRRAAEQNRFAKNALDLSAYFVRFEPAQIMAPLRRRTGEYRELAGAG